MGATQATQDLLRNSSSLPQLSSGDEFSSFLHCFLAVLVGLAIGIPMFQYKRKVATEAALNRDGRDMGDMRKDLTRMRDV